MLKKIPLADAYKTTLAQPLSSGDGAGSYIYCGSVPAITFPDGFTTSLRINGGNSLAEEIEVDQVDVPNKRWRIKTRNLPQGSGIVTSAQAHQTGAEVILSDSYAFWNDIANAINNYNGPFVTYADTAARDAAIPSPVNGQVCYVTSVGQIMQYVSGNWQTVANGTDYATTRVATSATANNGELFRDSAASNDLTYKDHGGTSVKLIVNATDKLATNVYDFATTGDMTTGTDTTKPVNAAGVAAITKFSATAGVALTAGQAVRYGNSVGYTMETIAQLLGPNSDTNDTIGYNATIQLAAQTFTPSSTGLLSAFVAKLRRYNSPAGNLTAKLWSGVPSSPVLVATSTNTIGEAGIATSATDYTFNFTGAQVNAGTVYGLTIEASRANSAFDNTIWEGHNANVYAGGSSYSVNSGGTWAINSGREKMFTLTISNLAETATKLYPYNLASGMDFLGFAVTSAAVDASVTVQAEGIFNGLSGLTAGTQYWATTNGALTATEPANGPWAPVGLAVSATSLDIKFVPASQYSVAISRFNSATSTIDASISSSGSVNHGLGVAPRMVRATITSQNSTSGAAGFWKNGQSNGVAFGTLPAPVNFLRAGVSNSSYVDVSISSVTASQVNFSWTETGSSSGSAYILWEFYA